MKKTFIEHFLLKLSGIFTMLFIWIVLSFTKWADEGPTRMWFAKIDEVGTAIVDIFATKIIHILSSFEDIFIASIIVLLLGVIFGLAIGFFENLYRSLKWPIDFWRSIPPIIVISVLLNLDGRDELFWRIWLVMFGALPIMIMQIADAVNNSSKKRMLIFEALKTKKMFIINNIIIYEILASLFSTTRTILSFAIIIIIVSEMVFSPQHGIGEQILHFQTASEIQYVYAYAIILGLIGLLLNGIIRLFEKKYVYWQ